MMCEHDDYDWAAFVAPNGSQFHVCRGPQGYVLYPGAPATGYGKKFDPRREAEEAMRVVPPNWAKLGWSI